MGRFGNASQRDARKMVFGKPNARLYEVILWTVTVIVARGCLAQLAGMV
jgi:hypothetical protein